MLAENEEIKKLTIQLQSWSIPYEYECRVLEAARKANEGLRDLTLTLCDGDPRGENLYAATVAVVTIINETKEKVDQYQQNIRDTIALSPLMNP